MVTMKVTQHFPLVSYRMYFIIYQKFAKSQNVEYIKSFDAKLNDFQINPLYNTHCILLMCNTTKN